VITVRQPPARASLLWLAPVLFVAVGCGTKAPTVVTPPPAKPTIALAKASDGGDVFEVRGLDANALDAWAKGKPLEADWRGLFSVEAVPPHAVLPERPSHDDWRRLYGDVKETPLAGRYDVTAGVLRFSPRFAVLPSLRYRAILHLTQLSGAATRGPSIVSALLRLPRPADVPPATIARVFPTADKVPENLLKIYLHFSAPMQRGDVYDFIKLLDDNGRPIVKPFLEVGEELWDPSCKRLTLLLDPGRVKQGLKPREELGPILQAGHEYTLVIEPSHADAAGKENWWYDAYGEPLTAPTRVRFRALPPDTRPVEPTEWTLSAPAAGGWAPLSVDLKRPLDHALLERVVRVVNADGKPVEGEIKLGEHETRWHFTPRAEWRAGDYVLEAESILEDLAGNRIGRAFEVDETGPQRDEPPTLYRRPFKIQ
jgi:hypothetical protein